MNPKYTSYYLFGLTHGDPIWAWKKWQHAVPLLDPVVSLCSDLPSIRVLLEERNREQVKFGRMNWNLKHNEKWASRCADAQCTFFDAEIAYPSRSKCNKTPDLEPEVLIIVANANVLGNTDCNVDQAIVIHIRHELLNAESQANVANCVDAISRLLGTRIAGHMRRPSAFRSQYGGYTDAIWHGTHGVLNAASTDFSSEFKSYGIASLGT